ncbi:hypothetical protein HNP84_009734 [Thermocatellispora tengchongensis]|uniref:Uncharacterized protein n=1 Tax=Thermocatellispora tengchongensis TaxID=1073253 RepID=A0A840PLZ3_9ACTN|nr:hypothetical protein [Thermocatellispora tengchongensis]MBB5139969.1 hypothetical protein [Thermocatellispora tengchongensis]
MRDNGRLTEGRHLEAGVGRRDAAQWRCRWKLEKFHGSDTGPGAKPFEVIEREGNALMYGGVSALWHRLTGGTAVTAFDAANARIGVGDGTAAADPVQTDLQGTSKLRKGLDATYPQHADGTGAAANAVTFRATFSTSEANFVWSEWGIFNAASGGRMLNRKVENLGQKTSAASWVFTVQLSLA